MNTSLHKSSQGSAAPAIRSSRFRRTGDLALASRNNPDACSSYLLGAEVLNERGDAKRHEHQDDKRDGLGSVVVAAVVALQEPVMASGRDVFLVEATSSSAKNCLLITVQMFEVQLDQARIVEISRKVVTGARWMSAHPDHCIPDLGRQMIAMFRIPGRVVPNLTTASEYAWLVAKYKHDDSSRDRPKPLMRSPHT
jgi:hypothetical protein